MPKILSPSRSTKALIGIALIWGAATAAEAQRVRDQNWVAWHEATNGSVYYYDPASIRRDGQVRTVTERIVWSLDGLKQVEEAWPGARYQVKVHSVDCSRETRRMLGWKTFDGTDRLIDEAGEGAEYPITGSFEKLRNIVCTS